ncbi:class I SAM-dependent methyltransferase [Nocardioides sp. GXZ039]|uniref:class I SAM-dependent methyltransferase n=1 Tax=Nocardioides sp. GXZ039 TaxID=3136018 RepID=UPI0030F42391
MEQRAQAHLDDRIQAFYGTEFDEHDRLVGRSGQGLLEFERTQRAVTERVPAGSRVIDVGGAAGIHAAALAERGDDVVLVDPVPRHVEQAAAHGTFTARLGDARELPAEADSFDAALLLGPLYHLAERADRLRALSEAMRVVRPGGWVFAAGVSRLSALSWVTVVEPALDPDVERPVDGVLPDFWRRLIAEGGGGLGPRGFPGGHFHLADELEREAVEAGLLDVTVIGLEGPGAQAIEVARSHDPALVEAARTLAHAFEAEPGLRDHSLDPPIVGLASVTRWVRWQGAVAKAFWLTVERPQRRQRAHMVARSRRESADPG